ncbi:tetratricopeptide repeat protein 29-like isoform X2 [Dysidea avara]|uniref:tetratricopeptide repeat protein 29-like isoform X2 n=1 Tax=Dysidea avara TaxID=196820 RepID=UPI003326D9BE
MAANILPPIPQASASGSRGQFVGQKLTQPKSATQSESVYNTNKFKLRKVSKDTSSSVTEHKARHSFIDPASYRNSLKHNICVEMLENGFHQSFAELFNLLEQQRLAREAAPAGTGPHLLPVIEEDGTKLDQMKCHLTAAESSRRTGDMESVYMSLRSLAQYFEQTGDIWLADHFHQRCLETSLLIKSDGRKKEGEAHCHVGLSLENRGDLVKSIEHLETFHNLAHKHKWHTDSGDSLHEISCEHLRRIYTKLAEEDSSKAINLLLKAYEKAKEGGHTYQEGVACYRLGNAYESIQESQTAIQYHRLYFERCKHFGNDEGVGLACEALARSYESLGELENAISYLDQYVEVSEKAGLQDQLAKACSAIGQMSNCLGDYKQAVDKFNRCYKLCVQLNNKEAVCSSRVQYGIAQGHHLMEDFSHSITNSPVTGIHTIVAWKDIRENPSGTCDVTDEETTTG